MKLLQLHTDEEEDEQKQANDDDEDDDDEDEYNIFDTPTEFRSVLTILLFIISFYFF
jgi:hypothetical protein